jgi:long-chain acyl-CoA synthetase
MEQENILRWFQDTAERRGEEPCLRFKKGKRWRTLSWLQTLNKIQSFSESLKALGIGHYDRVALLSNTRYEWTLFDMAILSLGAVTVPIYQSSRSEDILYILKDSEARIIIVEDSTQLEKILKIRAQLSHLEKIILIEGEVIGDAILTLKEFEGLAISTGSDFGNRIREISHDHLATLVYTSGTTGTPKGVMITHGNIIGEIVGVQEIFRLSPDSSGLFFLPLAHILARVIQFLQLAVGFSHAYAESIDHLVDNIQEIRPHFMVSVPRIFEKIYQNMLNAVENSSSLKQKLFRWACQVGKEYSSYSLAKREAPLSLNLRRKLAHQLVFSKLHHKLGGRIEFFVSGAAPLSQEIAEFFYGAGVLILEGYGLTETTAAINVNSFDDIAFGTVGRPVHGAEEKIAEDGEILVRGSMVSKGYWRNPEATEEAFEPGGWFHTGDIGEFDDSGRLKITDRKKDIIITAGGKNIAPQSIENVIKTNPLISQVMIHGDRRKFLSALITLNPEELKAKARALGVNGVPFSELVNSPQVYNEVKRIIEEKNKDLAKYETIKKFAILDKDFTIENGQLTPSLKIKRKVITEKYKDVLDGLYRD